MAMWRSKTKMQKRTEELDPDDGAEGTKNTREAAWRGLAGLGAGRHSVA